MSTVCQTLGDVLVDTKCSLIMSEIRQDLENWRDRETSPVRRDVIDMAIIKAELAIRKVVERFGYYD